MIKKGVRQGDRASALWGSGTRGGDSRGSALWGKGGRRAGATLLGAALAAVVLSFGASADNGSTNPVSGTFIPAALLSQAQADPSGSYKVIVQGNGSDDADHLAHKLAAWATQGDHDLLDAAKHAAADLAKAQSDLAKKQADATAKAAKAALTGKQGDKDAAAKAAQALAAAQAALAQATDASNAANTAAAGASTDDENGFVRDEVTNEFSSIDGVAITLTGREITHVYAHGNEGLLAITPDVPAQSNGVVQWSNSQLWPYVDGAANNWNQDQNAAIAANMPTIAIVDSGVDARADFGSRLLASVNLSSLPNNSPGDGRGHGTFVAGIAADSAPGYAGQAPNANLVSIDVLDDNGMGLTSDIINACQWILDHKAQYNIKVANFSLNSSITAPFYVDPLDRAVEKLWFAGVTVVTAAGNYGSAAGPSGVMYSPADDPFVVTVGALDINGTATTYDDTMAPWSSWGSTIDGFAKPDVAAPGRYMIGPASSTSTLAMSNPANIVAPGYLQASGTSFAAPVVSGAAAQIIARHPNFTPDQVKGALMLTTRPVNGPMGSAGVGEITANKAVGVDSPPNPNAGIDQFVKSDPTSGGVAFDSASWNSTALGNASWNSVSWNSASWNSASWNSASWNSVSWNSASWNSVSWNSASWNSVSWNSASWNSVSWNSGTDAA